MQRNSSSSFYIIRSLTLQDYHLNDRSKKVRDSFSFLRSANWYGTSVDITKIKEYMNILSGSSGDSGFSDNDDDDDNCSPSFGQEEKVLA